MPEMLERRLLGKGPLRAEISHLDRLLQRQAGRHDLAEQACHFLAVQWPGIAFHHPAQDLSLALRPIEHGVRIIRRLDVGDLLGAIGALADQPQQFAVDGIDTLPQGCKVQRRIRGVTHDRILKEVGDAPLNRGGARNPA